jgi:hypothetical protein
MQNDISREEPIDVHNKQLEEQLRPLKVENFKLSKQVDIETHNAK